MILYIQIIEDALDAISSDLSSKLRTLSPGSDFLSFDNFSEEWLVRNTIEQCKEQEELHILISRKNTAEFNNVQPFISQIPYFNRTFLLYQGLPTPIIKKLGLFPKVNVEIIDQRDDLVNAYQNLLKDL